MATLNPNQFQQVPIQGDLDLHICESNTFSARISTNQVSSLNAGTAVKLDSAITSGNFPQVVAAGPTDKPIGYIKRIVKATVFNTGDVVEVSSSFGCVMWLVANMTIPCGSAVEQSTNGANVQVLGTGASYKQIGVALDPMTNGQLGRVILSSAA